MKLIDKRIERPDLMAKQIIKLYNQATEHEQINGSGWYQTAHDISAILSNKFELPVYKTAGVIAALSPATNWVQNIADSHNLMLAYFEGIDPAKVVVTTYGNNKQKAINILNASDRGEVEDLLLGNSKINKTTCFYTNILRPECDDLVTIDRHAIRIAISLQGADNVCMTEKRYRNIAQAYRIAANKLQISAIDLQAIVWVAYRRINGILAAKIENEVYISILEQL